MSYGVRYQIATIPMTLRDLQGHFLIARFFKSDFSLCCAAFDKISTDSALHSPSAIAEFFVIMYC